MCLTLVNYKKNILDIICTFKLDKIFCRADFKSLRALPVFLQATQLNVRCFFFFSSHAKILLLNVECGFILDFLML